MTEEYKFHCDEFDQGIIRDLLEGIHPNQERVPTMNRLNVIFLKNLVFKEIFKMSLAFCAVDKTKIQK